MDLELIQGIFDLLDDEQMEGLANLAFAERRKREDRKVDNGEYCPLLNEEKELYKVSHPQAIIAYKNRTGYGLLMAKLVVEKECGGE